MENIIKMVLIGTLSLLLSGGAGYAILVSMAEFGLARTIWMGILVTVVIHAASSLIKVLKSATKKEEK